MLQGRIDPIVSDAQTWLESDVEPNVGLEIFGQLESASGSGRRGPSTCAPVSARFAYVYVHVLLIVLIDVFVIYDAGRRRRSMLHQTVVTIAHHFFLVVFLVANGKWGGQIWRDGIR